MVRPAPQDDRRALERLLATEVMGVPLDEMLHDRFHSALTVGL